MDSKNIYIACTAMMRKAHWDGIQDGREWRFVGEGNDFRQDVAQGRIDDFFSGSSIYIVVDRNNSREISKNLSAKIVKDELRGCEVTLCEKDFKRFITFHYIGVAKEGEYVSS